MQRIRKILFAAAVVMTASAASAQGLTEAGARALIVPWYSLFNVATRGDVETTRSKCLLPNINPVPATCQANAGVRNIDEVVGNFANSIPDMTFEIKEVLVTGDRVIVRGEVAGTPAGDLFGVPHSGKSFKIMTIDIQTIRDGKIAKTFHMENWLSALGQLRAKRYAKDRH